MWLQFFILGSSTHLSWATSWWVSFLVKFHLAIHDLIELLLELIWLQLLVIGFLVVIERLDLESVVILYARQRWEASYTITIINMEIVLLIRIVSCDSIQGIVALLSIKSWLGSVF